MKSKLTLRLNADLKERAKQLADERDTSVSKLVENYFRLLLRDSSVEDAKSPSGSSSSPEEASERLSPRIQDLQERLGRPAPAVTMDEDTRHWVEAAAEKHA